MSPTNPFQLLERLVPKQLVDIPLELSFQGTWLICPEEKQL